MNTLNIQLPPQWATKIAEIAKAHESATDDELVAIILQNQKNIEAITHVLPSQVDMAMQYFAAQDVLQARRGAEYVENIAIYGTPYPTKIDIVWNRMNHPN
jgi:hypothetical protein